MPGLRAESGRDRARGGERGTRVLLASLACIAMFTSCDSRKNEMTLTRSPFGRIGETAVEQFTLTNGSGMTMKIITYGAAVTHLIVPARDGTMADVALGFDSLQGYLRPDNPYFGCIAGRYANRIAGAKFALDGTTYTLAANNHGNALHGGIKGFDKAVWEATPLPSGDGVKFSYRSADGEEGYPGNLLVEVTYTITPGNEVRIEYYATADKPTPVNLTHHGYFNLSGGSDPDVLGHELSLRADQYTQVDDGLIPTGLLPGVAGTAMDFRKPKAIGAGIGDVKGGYDHNWVLTNPGDLSTPAATLYHAGSGRLMQVFTTEPGIQFYAGNFLDSTLHGKGGRVYPKHGGLCLEAQHFPDSPHHPSFPNTILKPGERYRQTTVYSFSTR